MTVPMARRGKGIWETEDRGPSGVRKQQGERGPESRCDPGGQRPGGEGAGGAPPPGSGVRIRAPHPQLHSLLPCDLGSL